MIQPGYKLNFETMLKAAKHGDLCIMECQDKATGREVITICMTQFDGHEWQFTPVAKMFDGNPYEELNPPNPDGGFYDGRG